MKTRIYKGYGVTSENRRKLALRILQYDVDDERFRRIFGETAKVICASEHAFSDMPEGMIDEERAYLEE